MSVDNATVTKIAKLARIAVTDAEVEALVPELNNILGWVEQLGEVDVTGVEPMTAVIANSLRLRDDVVNADPLTIDVKNVGGVQKLEIGLPSMTGTVTVANINIGGNYAAGALTGGTSIGGLAISDINMGGSAIRVWGH